MRVQMLTGGAAPYRFSPLTSVMPEPSVNR